MNRSIVGWIVAIILAFGGAALAWVWFAGGSGEPTTELTTPTIASAPTSEPSSSDTVSSSSGTDVDDSPIGSQAFVIDPIQSIVSFEIDEVLQGSPQHVVGTTDQVVGQVQVDLDDLSSAQLSQIVINARTLATDSGRRDRAIRGPVILNSASDEHELITFDVASIEGLEGAAGPGDSLEFSVTGDLLIRGNTNEVTFEVVVDVIDTSTLEGSASAQVLRSDFGIGIPSVPGVANVTDEVLLTIAFVAVAG